jgi:hypothetical protein
MLYERACTLLLVLELMPIAWKEHHETEVGNLWDRFVSQENFSQGSLLGLPELQNKMQLARRRK